MVWLLKYIKYRKTSNLPVLDVTFRFFDGGLVPLFISDSQPGRILTFLVLGVLLINLLTPASLSSANLEDSEASSIFRVCEALLRPLADSSVGRMEPAVLRVTALGSLFLVSSDASFFLASGEGPLLGSVSIGSKRSSMISLVEVTAGMVPLFDFSSSDCTVLRVQYRVIYAVHPLALFPGFRRELGNEAMHTYGVLQFIFSYACCEET